MVTAYGHFIDGAYVDPASGEYLIERNPATGAEIYRIARGGRPDVAAAVASAQRAFLPWADRRPIERGRVLMAIAQAIRENADLIVSIERNETGKPPSGSRGEVEASAQYFEFYGGLVNALHGRVIDLGARYHSYTVQEPYGVVGVILPWNAPINQAARGIAPALAAGNTVVAKPSEFTSVSLLELAKIAVERCGLPAGVLNVVTGTGAETGAALVDHPQVRKVAFTGSVRAGREIGRAAAERFLPLTLELGGKSPNIVFADADLDAAAVSSVKAFTMNSGQICAAGSRLLVQSSVHDAFLERLKAVVEAAASTDSEEAPGPMITRDQFAKVQGYLATAEQEGASVVVGGRTFGDAFVETTILSGVRNDMRIAREEIFGPVLSVIRFEDEAEAVRIANDSDYGLVACVWTADISRAHRVARQIEAGQVFINEYFAGGVETPFGGYKNSGYGREKGLEALFQYTHVKCITARI